MPYVTVLPIHGNQWKTIGGSLDFFRRTWLRTFNTTASTTNEAKPATARRGVGAFEVKLPSGPATFSRSPIAAEMAVQETLEAGKGQTTTSCSSQISLGTTSARATASLSTCRTCRMGHCRRRFAKGRQLSWRPAGRSASVAASNHTTMRPCSASKPTTIVRKYPGHAIGGTSIVGSTPY